MQRPTLLERAFDVARYGPVTDVTAIRVLLKREGYESVDLHLKSQSVARQLRAFCKARAPEAALVS